jgi:hypothetical protein
MNAPVCVVKVVEEAAWTNYVMWSGQASGVAGQQTDLDQAICREHSCLWHGIWEACVLESYKRRLGAV